MNEATSLFIRSNHGGSSRVLSSPWLLIELAYRGFVVLFCLTIRFVVAARAMRFA